MMSACPMEGATRRDPSEGTTHATANPSSRSPTSSGKGLVGNGCSFRGLRFAVVISSEALHDFRPRVPRLRSTTCSAGSREFLKDSGRKPLCIPGMFMSTAGSNFVEDWGRITWQSMNGLRTKKWLFFPSFVAANHSGMQSHTGLIRAITARLWTRSEFHICRSYQLDTDIISVIQSHPI